MERAGQSRRVGGNVTAKDAYIANAQFHLDWVRKTINDGLTGVNDYELKESLLQDLDSADLNLRKALL